MAKKSLKSRFILLFFLSLVSILGIYYILDRAERSPIITCSAEWGFINTKQPKYYTSAEKIMIRPWLGQHHVYAVFMIPNSYQHEYLFKLDWPKEKTRCGVIHRLEQRVVDGVVAKPGYYLLKGYLNTRIALSLIMQGKLNQLRQLQNWQLGYLKKINP